MDMTFKEAYDSGYRFKLPKDYTANTGDWPDNFYWQQGPNNTIIIPGIGEVQVATVFEYNDSSWGSSSDIVKKYQQSDDWYIHPDDVYKFKFEQEWKKLTNDS